MKRIIVLLLLAVSFTIVNAKGSYVPTAFARINVTCGDRYFCDSTSLRTLSVDGYDNLFKVSIEHESLSRDYIKNIRRTKRAANWAMAAAILSGVSAGMNNLNTPRDAVNYMIDMDNAYYSASLSGFYREEAADLQRLKILCTIENTSREELIVNDQVNGLCWFIDPGEELSLPLGNPGIRNLRIAPAKYDENRIHRVSLQAANMLERGTMKYEDEEYVIVPCYGEGAMKQTFAEGQWAQITGYLKYDLEDFSCVKLSEEEFKDFKAQMKAIRKEEESARKANSSQQEEDEYEIGRE